MCIRDRLYTEVESLPEHGIMNAFDATVTAYAEVGRDLWTDVKAVSYTHLDVYKRQTQNRICWLMAQSSRLVLGTADAEWAVAGGQGVMTATNARADNHGFVGSSDVPAMMATDKVLYICLLYTSE